MREPIALPSVPARMSDTELTILPATVFDNPDDRRVEFDAEGSGDLYPFAVSYRVLEALSATNPEQEQSPAAWVMFYEGRIAAAAAKALARGQGTDRTVIDESDIG